MKILIVDDHPLYIDGLRSFMSGFLNELEIIEAPSFDRAMESFRANKFDLALIDFKLSEMTGLDLLQALLARNIDTPLSIISGEDAPSIAKRALDLGASGFIPKSLSASELSEAIKALLRGEEFLTSTMRRLVNQLNHQEYREYVSGEGVKSSILTARQLDVIQLLAKGYSNKQISRVLNLSIDTVKEHIQNIFLKLDVNNRTLCVIRAKEAGITILQ